MQKIEMNLFSECNMKNFHLKQNNLLETLSLPLNFSPIVSTIVTFLDHKRKSVETKSTR